MTAMSRRAVPALVLALAVTAAAPAGAGKPSRALRAEFQAGVDAFRLGHLDAARKHLEKARAMDPKLPGPHRFLAAVAREQEHWDACIAEARRALALAPHSSEVADTRKLHEGCRAAAGRPAYHGEPLGDRAAIAVTANVSGATVRIGGLIDGGTPLEPRPIAAGSLAVVVTKAGWKPAHVTVEALPGIVTDLAVVLAPVPTRRPAPHH